MHRYEVVDVFTDTPLQGNPVAVFTDATGLSAEVMQSAARELNLSESVFVVDGRQTRPDMTPTSASSPRRPSSRSLDIRCSVRRS